MIRLSKAILVAAIAFYCLLAGFGNFSDYGTNFVAVQRVLTLAEVFPTSAITFRAVTNPIWHHAAYLLIIGLEIITGLVCAYGAWLLFRARNETAYAFNHAKTWAVMGLTLGFLTWQLIFMSVGGEWFGMWMSATFKGALAAAFQIHMTIVAVLIYLVYRDE